MPRIAFIFCILLLVLGSAMVIRRFERDISNATPHPAKTKLGDFATDVFKAHFVAPRGELFNLVVGLPGGGDLSSEFTGGVVVRHAERIVAEFTVTPQSVKVSNWLSSEGLTSYILTWYPPSNVLERVLVPANSYEVILSLDKPLTQPASLWLTFVQPFGEYKKTRDRPSKENQEKVEGVRKGGTH